MNRLALSILLAAGLLLSLATAAAAAAPQPNPAAAKGSLLFVEQSGGGAIERVGPKAFELRLTDVSPDISSFTDRPRRRAGAEPIGRFVRRWSAEGFAADPPNAALVVAGAAGARDVAIVTLSHPRYDRRARTLSFRAVPLRNGDTGALAGLARRGDPLRERRFGHASLFIDDGGGADYHQIFLQLQGVESGERILLELAPVDSGRIAWSLGRPGQNSDGFQLIAQQGLGISLSQLGVSSSQLSFITSATGFGGEFSLSVSLFLEEESATDFYLRAVGGAGTDITASIDNEQPEVVNQTPTLFIFQ